MNTNIRKQLRSLWHETIAQTWTGSNLIDMIRSGFRRRRADRIFHPTTIHGTPRRNPAQGDGQQDATARGRSRPSLYGPEVDANAKLFGDDLSRSPDWLKMKNSDAPPAVTREAEGV
jgi:hypothetical protein